jgi:hypothetical protein
MRTLMKLAVTAVVLAITAVAAPGNAMTMTVRAYSQTTFGFSCDDGGDSADGGTIYVFVSGQETRPSDKHFRTFRVKTQLIAQEKNYAGVWVDVAKTGKVVGKRGRIISAGANNVSPYLWGGVKTPELALAVGGNDDLFRAKVVTKVYDDEWVLLATLTTVEGQCRL